MMAANKTKRSYAEEGLEEIQQEVSELQVVSNDNDGEEENKMVNVGGLEPLAGYYQVRDPKPGYEGLPILKFKEGETLKGTYEKQWARASNTREGRKFTSYTYIVRLSDGKLYGLSGPGLGSINPDKGNRGFQALEPGPNSKVHITYKGQQEGKDGNTYHNFIILGNRVKKG